VSEGGRKMKILSDTLKLATICCNNLSFLETAEKTIKFPFTNNLTHVINPSVILVYINKKPLSFLVTKIFGFAEQPAHNNTTARYTIR
jgi:hypothetical protein